MPCRKKSTDGPRGHWRRGYHWGLKEDPINDDAWEDPIKKPKEDPITVKPKEENPKRTFGNFQTLNDFCIAKNSCFWVMVYDTLADGDKHSYEAFGLGRIRFYATRHLKSWTSFPQYHVIATTAFLKSRTAKIFFLWVTTFNISCRKRF